ncbi:interferon regulatory factor 3 isoform X1 [Mustela erminea]|uniref:interferon regulatory factor 3 isoform X1 n=1 Tax=Mustela erminea TaxID=36723 RepID=UPI0013871000|nr:interferon regulatory factor 3 isoform X1 [Mustela erminea]XP_032181385.1 interferon regulatory factor 3 isoform X1 [Mustela erminea]XP_032181386.1 interferon regulatory factor 3 isoform X1 [Mustela erminea]
MGTPKPRILPWLVSQLDLGQLEGVAWLDESRTRFRIPWKHGLRQDAQQEDFGIFQAWAEASGAYTPGKDKPDLPTWKRNFRSALNRKEGLRLAEDRSKDPHDPHKVYEFVIPGAGNFPELDTSLGTNGGCSTLATQGDILEELLNDMALAPFPDGGPSSLAVVPEQTPPFLLSPTVDIPPPCPNSEPPENPLRRLLVPEEEWEFEVTAFYRGRQVFQQTVFCPRGLRLVASEAGDRTLSGQLIILPDPGLWLTDRGVLGYVRRVLSCLGGGLALCRAGQRLWARRLGHCHTYWALGEELLPDSSHGPSGEVPKDEEGDVFDLRPFVSGCSHMPEGPAGHGTIRGRFLTREHCGPPHFQQLPTLSHIRAVQGLPPGPGRGHGFLGHGGGLIPHSSRVLPPRAFTLAINYFLPLSPLVCLVLGVSWVSARSRVALT